MDNSHEITSHQSCSHKSNSGVNFIHEHTSSMYTKNLDLASPRPYANIPGLERGEVRLGKAESPRRQLCQPQSETII